MDTKCESNLTSAVVLAPWYEVGREVGKKRDEK